MSDINVTVQDEIVNIDVLDTPVLVNVVNSPGQQGPAGPGVPVGGTAGQVLAKNSSTNYDTVWVNQSGGVPYSGATGNVNLGEYELKAGQVTLDTSPTGTAAVGTTRWNDTTGTSETTLKGGNVILKNGVDLVARVVNKVTPNTTLTKAAYQAVRVSGAQGQRLAVAFAQANNDANSADTIGIVIETIPTNQEGFIMTMGQLENINTTGSLQGETWVDGDVLYLSPTTAGALTNIKPTGAGHIVVIGYVEYAHVNNGKIYTKVMNGWELDELHDVDIISPANNEALIYESSTSLWKNKTIATALGFTPVPTTRTITINGVTFDLSADRTWTIAAGISGSGAAGQVTYWTGASAVSGSSAFLWDNVNSKLRVNGGIGINRDASGVRALDITGGGIRLTGSTSGSFEVNGSDSTFNINTTGGVVGFNIIDTSNAIISITGNSYAYRLLANASLFRIRDINAGNIDRFAIHSTGNIGIGFGSTDPAVRLGVSGDTLLRGSGNTNSTTALTVQNSSSENILRIRNDGFYLFGSSSQRPLFATVSGISTPSISGTALQFSIDNASARTATGFDILFSYGTRDYTSGNVDVHRETATFSPTSGTGTMNMLAIYNTINQTGGANGITRGLYVNPTLTAAADFRAIEVSAGVTVLAPSATARASLRIPSGTAPTSPVDGDIWFDGTDIKMRIGGVTKTFTLI